MNQEALLVVLGAIVGYQLWVSILVLRAPMYEPKQKWLQLVGIWLFPIFGAVVAHSLLQTEGKPLYKPDKNWTEPGDNAS